MKKLRGRPKKPPDELRNVELVANATVAEATAVRAAAGGLRMSVSAWLMRAAAEALRQQGVKVEQPSPKRRGLRALGSG